jgi:hypothetical protein
VIRLIGLVAGSLALFLHLALHIQLVQCQYMLKFDMRGAVNYLTDMEKGGVLLPDDNNKLID